MKKKQRLFYVFLRVLCVGIFCVSCTSTWVIQKANPRHYAVETSLSKVKNVYNMLGKELVVQMERSTFPEKHQKEFPEEEHLCIFWKEKGRSLSSRAIFLTEGKEKEVYCEFMKQHALPGMMPVSSIYGKSLIVPQLNVGVEGIPGVTSGRADCECQALEGVKAKAKSAYLVGKDQFYLELDNSQWVHFKSSRGNYWKIFRANLSDKKSFLEVEKSQIKELKIMRFAEGQVFFSFNMAGGKEQLFAGMGWRDPSFPGSAIYRVVLGRNIEREIREPGNKLYYMLMPFAVVWDVLSFPIQAGIYIYKTKEEQKKAHNSKM